MTEYYPADVVFISANPPPAIGDHIWLYPSLAAGEHVLIVIQVQVMALPGSLLTNGVVVESAETGPVMAQEQTTVAGKGGVRRR